MRSNATHPSRRWLTSHPAGKRVETGQAQSGCDHPTSTSSSRAIGAVIRRGSAGCRQDLIYQQQLPVYEPDADACAIAARHWEAVIDLDDCARHSRAWLVLSLSS